MSKEDVAVFKLIETEQHNLDVTSPCGDVLKTYTKDNSIEAELIINKLNEYYGELDDDNSDN